MLAYTDQSSGGLKYYLTSSDYDVEFMKVVKREIISDEDISIEFGILGASHYLKVSGRGGVMTEIFACSELPKESGEIVFADKAGASNLSLNKDVGEMRYSFRSQLHRFSSESSRNLFNDLNEMRFFNDNPNKYYLGFEFPSADGNNLPCLTLIGLEINKREKTIDMQTIHCYQAEERFVETKTKVNYV